jgi:hypothetical protein
MNPTCFRCGRPGFATLKVEATIGATQIKISGQAAAAGICPSCMVAFAEFVEAGHPDLVPRGERPR